MSRLDKRRCRTRRSRTCPARWRRTLGRRTRTTSVTIAAVAATQQDRRSSVSACTWTWRGTKTCHQPELSWRSSGSGGGGGGSVGTSFSVFVVSDRARDCERKTFNSLLFTFVVFAYFLRFPIVTASSEIRTTLPPLSRRPRSSVDTAVTDVRSNSARSSSLGYLRRDARIVTVDNDNRTINFIYIYTRKGSCPFTTVHRCVTSVG